MLGVQGNRNRRYASLVLLFFCLFVALSFAFCFIQNWKAISNVEILRSERLQQNRAVNDIEIGIWEASHAVLAYLHRPSGEYLSRYKKKVRSVSQQMQQIEGVSLLESENVALKQKIRGKWRTLILLGDEVLSVRTQIADGLQSLNALIHESDDVVDYKIQAKFIPGTKGLLPKEQAIREVEVSLWEMINATNLYVTYGEKNYLEEINRQERDVEYFFTKYKSLPKDADENRHATEFWLLYQKALKETRALIELKVSLQGNVEKYYKATHAIEDLIEFEIRRSFYEDGIGNSLRQTYDRLILSMLVLGIGILCLLLMVTWQHRKVRLMLKSSTQVEWPIKSGKDRKAA